MTEPRIDTDGAGDEAGLSEVLRLVGVLSEQVLDAQITGRPVPEAQSRALAKAAGLLREHDVPWPPLLAQALHELGLAAEGEPAEPGAEARPVIQGLTRLLGAFRRDRASP
ncbi:hypothetical protein Q8W71_15345 [Methylobacterium sp. NEAU 140]|uniref:hypothetical protein n=1 Tax=Methylobacterium sp. NEAU 140 TaxID=3064945 RepID=UPI002736888F|nr:hypothetical protein [Methylobacterium sp. NEAU 140]MDP4024005.1 hypothetical protein [Methylobacterium sp. NEAU 140]